MGDYVSNATYSVSNTDNYATISITNATITNVHNVQYSKSYASLTISKVTCQNTESVLEIKSESPDICNPNGSATAEELASMMLNSVSKRTTTYTIDNVPSDGNGVVIDIDYDTPYYN